MIAKIGLTLVALAILVLVLVAKKPNDLQIERTIRIAAPADAVFSLINDFHKWPDWAPQDQEDHSMRRNFSGAASGAGAVSGWRGSGSTGEGRMEIVESVPDREVTVQVDFARPFVAHNINRFVLRADGDATEVSWRMQGTNPLIAKVMSVFVDMDRMMGKHFESGLRNLKAAAERPPVADNGSSQQ